MSGYYRIILCGATDVDLYDPAGDLLLAEPKLVQDIGSAETLDFTIPHSHPSIGVITPYKSTIRVTEGGDTIFYGRAKPPEKDIYGNATYHCTGALEWLNDIPLPASAMPAYSGTVDSATYAADILAHYNSRIGSGRTIGTAVLPAAGVGAATREWKGQTCFDALKDECSDAGLAMFTRYSDSAGQPMLRLTPLADYLSGFGTGNQPIRLGLNLLSLESSHAEIYTSVCCVGKDGLTVYATNPLDVSTYGVLCAYKEWRDVTDANELQQLGFDWLRSQSFGTATYSVSAVDLAPTVSTYGRFEIARKAVFDGSPWGLGQIELPITRIETDIARGEKKISLGLTIRNSLGLSHILSAINAIRRGGL